MKDAAHHRVHVQKKIIRSMRKEVKPSKINGTNGVQTSWMLDGAFHDHPSTMS